MTEQIVRAPWRSPLRVYLPNECDEHGVPVDWSECQTCHGTGRGWSSMVVGGAMPPNAHELPCPTCDGYGSLKAAAFAEAIKPQIAEEYRRTRVELDPEKLPDDGDAARVEIVKHITRIEETAEKAKGVQVRCEDCAHPMSDGSWDGDVFSAPSVARGVTTHPSGRSTRRDWEAVHLEAALRRIGADWHPFDEAYAGAITAVHYSRCDEGCRHGSADIGYRWYIPVQGWVPGGLNLHHDATIGEYIARVAKQDKIESAWRGVDVRRMSWPHDLRSEHLRVLCLRCWAAL